MAQYPSTPSSPSFPEGSSPLSTSTPTSPRFRTSFVSGVPVGGRNGSASPYISPYLAHHQNISRHQQQRPLSSSAILSLSNTFPSSPSASHPPGAWTASSVSGASGILDASGVPFDMEDIDMSDSEREQEQEQKQEQEEDGGDEEEDDEEGESIDSDDSDISSDETDKDKGLVRDREREAAPITTPSAFSVPAPMPVVVPVSSPSSTAVPSPRMITARLGLFGVDSIFKGINRRSEDSVSVASASSTDTSRRNSHQSVSLPPIHHPTYPHTDHHIQYNKGFAQESSILAAADNSEIQQTDIPKAAVSIVEIVPPTERIPTPSALASPPPPEPELEPASILAPAPAPAPPFSIQVPEDQGQVLDLRPTESLFHHHHLIEPHPYSESILSDASESTLTDDAFLPSLLPSPAPSLIPVPAPISESVPAPASTPAAVVTATPSLIPLPAPIFESDPASALTPAAVVTAAPEPVPAPAPMMIAVQQQHAPQTYELASRITERLQNSLAAASTRVMSFSMLASDNSSSDSASMTTTQHQQLQLHPTKTLVTTDTTATSTSVTNNVSSSSSSPSSSSFTSELNLLQTSVSSLHQRLDRIEQSLILNSNRNRSITTRGMAGTVLGVVKMVVKQGVIHAVLIVIILLVLYKRKSPIAMVILAHARGQLGAGDRTKAGVLGVATAAASASASGMATSRGRGGSWWYVMKQLL